MNCIIQDLPNLGRSIIIPTKELGLGLGLGLGLTLTRNFTLNQISEMIWGRMKAILRRSPKFDYSHLVSDIKSLLEGDGDLILHDFRKYSRHRLRFMYGYKEGLSGQFLEYVIKVYKGHRVIPKRIISKVLQDFNRYLIKRTFKSTQKESEWMVRWNL